MSLYRAFRDPAYRVGYWPLNNHAQDVSGHGNHGTWSAAEAYATGPNGRQLAVLNGTTASVVCDAVGVVRTLSFGCYVTTTTEELLLLSAGNDIMVNAGTITYTGVAATATYVNGIATTTMSANIWSHVVCVLNADHTADAFTIGTDGTNFGNIEIAHVRAYNISLTADEAQCLYRYELGGGR